MALYNKPERQEVVLAVGVRYGQFVGCDDHFSVSNHPYWYILEDLLRAGS